MNSGNLFWLCDVFIYFERSLKSISYLLQILISFFCAVIVLGDVTWRNNQQANLHSYWLPTFISSSGGGIRYMLYHEQHRTFRAFKKKRRHPLGHHLFHSYSSVQSYSLFAHRQVQVAAEILQWNRSNHREVSLIYYWFKYNYGLSYDE